MLFKLAWGNVRRSFRDFAIYFVTLVLGVAVFYAFNTISDQADFLSLESTSEMIKGLAGILSGVTIFLAIVLGFLMVYANNYLVRRRKRELGLYQVLGMRPGQVARVLTLETLIASVASFVVGIVVGLILAQLLVFVTAALFQDHVTYFAFRFSPSALGLTLGCFVVIFAVMLVMNLFTLRRSKLIDLMGADRVNEAIKVRSVPVMAVVFVVGLALIVWSYVRLLRDGLPITDASSDAGTQFTITTVMVVVGTILFFYAVSGFLLKATQAARGFYWRDLNAFTMRDLNAKINTTSISMAVISMVLFLAITSVTGGLSICTTLMDSMESHTPYDASISSVYYEPDIVPEGTINPEGKPEAAPTEPVDLAKAVAEQGVDLSSVVAKMAQVDIYSSENLVEPGMLTVQWMMRVSGASLAGQTPEEVGDGTSDYDDGRPMLLMGQTQYNEMRALQGLEPVDLGEDGCLFSTDSGESLADFFRAAVRAGARPVVAGRELHPVGDGVVSGAEACFMTSPMGMNGGTLIVPDDIARQGLPYGSYLNLMYADGVSEEQAEAVLSEVQADYSTRLYNDEGVDVGRMNILVSRADAYETTNSTSGLVSYLAIYIGFVLVIACAAILAIQQLSGASDATGRYRLLGELGCPERLMYRALLRQTLLYFVAPLLVALAHSVVALHVVTDVVALFGHMDITTPALMSGGAFVLVYGGYLLVTYRVSRGVVRAGVAQRALRRE